MGIKFTTTAKAQSNGVKVLVYGRSGSGKTCLCATAPKPLIISCEGKLLSLKKHNIPAIRVKTLADIEEALDWVKKKAEAKGMKSICLDSISDIAKTVLADRKKTNKDVRKAYGELGEDMDRIIKAFRDLSGFNVYFIAKEKESVNEEELTVSYVPSMPSRSITNDLPYYFDEVFYLGVDKNKKRFLLTSSDSRYTTNDSSGCLAEKEKPDLTYIFNKIEGS